MCLGCLKSQHGVQSTAVFKVLCTHHLGTNHCRLKKLDSPLNTLQEQLRVVGHRAISPACLPDPQHPLCSQGRVSPHSSICSGTHYTDQAVLSLRDETVPVFQFWNQRLCHYTQLLQLLLNPFLTNFLHQGSRK